MDYMHISGEMTIPSEHDLEHSKVFKTRGIKAMVSDYAKATGVSAYEYEKEEYASYFLSDIRTSRQSQCLVVRNRTVVSDLHGARYIGVRPKISFSNIQNLCTDIKVANDGVLEANLGLFPDDIVDRNMSHILNSSFNSKALKESPIEYTVDQINKFNMVSPFRDTKNQVYEYEGNLYVRVRVNCSSDELISFSNGEKHRGGEYIWCNLKPIKILIDDDENVAYFEKIIIGGIPFNISINNIKNSFKNTILYYYLNNYLIKEIMQTYRPKEKKTLAPIGKEKTLATIENDKLRKFNFLAIFLERIYNIFPFLKKKTAIPESVVTEIANSNIIDAEGVVVPEAEEKALEVKKEEVEVIDVERINELCDYIREKAPLLIPTKRKEVLEKLRTLLSNNKKEMDDLDSDMYIKYNLTVCDYDTSKKILWQELNGLKLEVDTALGDVNNLVNYGLDYVTYLKNLIEEYRKIDKQEWSDNRKEYLVQFLKIIDKIDADFNKIAPYLRDEILELIFLTINTIINIPWEQSSEFKAHYCMTDFFMKREDIANKLINWFELYYLENEDKLSEELRKRYYNLKFDDRKINKLYYIVELAHIIDPTLFLEKETKAK